MTDFIFATDKQDVYMFNIIFLYLMQNVVITSGDVTLVSAYMIYITVMAEHIVEMGAMSQLCVVSIFVIGYNLLLSLKT